MKTRIFYLLIIAFICIVYAFACRVALGQSDTCANGDQLVLNTSTKRYQCITPGTLPAGTGTTMIIANDTITGTTVNRLAKLTGAPSKAIITTTVDTDGAVGIISAGAGTTGSATITILGQASCEFDGATTAGNYVVISAITAGMCHDAGSSFPTAQAAYGRVLSTNGGAGTFVIELMTPDIAFQNAGNGKSKPGSPTGSVQFNNSGTFGGSANFTYSDVGNTQLKLGSGDTATPVIGLNSTNTGIYNAGGNIGFTFSGTTKIQFGDHVLLLNGGTYGIGTDTALRRESANIMGLVNSPTGATDWIELKLKKIITHSNCINSAGAAACGAAAAGSVVIDAGATTVVVSTTSVTVNSQIFVQYDSSLSTRLSVTCNATVALPVVTARTAATSFTITVPVAPITNPACYSYFIVN